MTYRVVTATHDATVQKQRRRNSTTAPVSSWLGNARFRKRRLELIFGNIGKLHRAGGAILWDSQLSK
jgi:hypothetical protein